MDKGGRKRYPETTMNLNKAFIIGRLTADPQLRNTAGGQAVATFSVATNRSWTNKAGQKQEDTQFHNIVVWGRQAEIATRFLKKGATVLIEGRIQTRNYDDKQGQKRYVTEIVCERFQFGPRPSGDHPFGGERGNDSGFDESPKDDEPLPEIDLEEGEIRAEDIPF